MVNLEDPDEATASLQQCMEGLLSSCVAEEVVQRPTSAVILDDLKPHLHGEKSSSGMLYDLVAQVATGDVEGTASRREALRSKDVEMLTVCHRLILAGARRDAASVDLAAAFINFQYEQLFNASQPGGADCPFWKLDTVYTMLLVLRVHGVTGEVREYDLGDLDYMTLQAATSAHRAKFLLTTIESIFAPKRPELRNQVAKEMLKELGTRRLLEL